MRKALVLLLAVFLLQLFAGEAAKAQDKVEIFGGYSFVHASTTWDETILCPVGLTCPATVVNPKLNLNGWEVSGVYNLHTWLGVKADFSGHYGSFDGASYHQQNYLFGPQIMMPGKFRPFAHVLFGGAHNSSGTGTAPGNGVTAGDIVTQQGGSPQNAFAAVFGAGIDVQVLPNIYVRPVQIDYLLTHFHGSTQSQPRYSAGVVVHF